MKILSFFNIRTLILYVLRYLANVTPDQWSEAVIAVKMAETHAQSGSRAKWVTDILKRAYPALTATKASGIPQPETAAAFGRFRQCPTAARTLRPSRQR